MDDSTATRPSLLVRVRDATDHPAWSEFVEIYGPLIYSHCRKRNLQDADAADVTQDVLRVVAEAIRGFDYDAERGSFRGWLYTVVRNKVNTFLSRRARREQGSGDTEALAKLHEQPAPEEESQEWERDYEQRMLHWAAERVRPEVAENTWQAFWQTAVAGKSAKDVAAGLGMAVASVYMAKSRVMARLKKVIEEVES